MAEAWVWLAQAIWLMLPAYAANMSAVKLGGGTPMDFGKVLRDGRRVFGPGKTWRGFLLGGLAGVLVGAALHALAPLAGNGLTDFGPGAAWVPIAAGLAFGALLGDATKSFVKRRVGKERGAAWYGPDQLDFVLGAWALALLLGEAAIWAGLAQENWLRATLTLPLAVIILVLTPALHLATNWLGHRYGHKEVPW
ncbi:MAG TPA: CDP-2,3-bis-(O-geranylgeranyl)-sn-glycerol synthase [Candidatus Thermoplasmatota archaeon]|nr:CDP-2,3-bis-(O-geranylgeranyl)-sn-glycerol synthase [Candidatus Thermoplasmatota archaeon]